MSSEVILVLFQTGLGSIRLASSHRLIFITGLDYCECSQEGITLEESEQDLLFPPCHLSSTWIFNYLSSHKAAAPRSPLLYKTGVDV